MRGNSGGIRGGGGERCKQAVWQTWLYIFPSLPNSLHPSLYVSLSLSNILQHFGKLHFILQAVQEGGLREGGEREGL